MMLIDETCAIMEPPDLAALPEYSSTLPTGQTIGKRWKRRMSNGWMLGEYRDEPDQKRYPGLIQIYWRPLYVIGEVCA